MHPLVPIIYRLLPPFGRELMASARGYQLRRWRYGELTEHLVEEALARENWSPVQWMKWQQNRLVELLHRAATKVPYYRQQWSERRRRGDNSSWEDLRNWPVLRKEVFRGNHLAFLAEDCNPRHMYCDQTSGTSGTPVKILFGRKTMQAWYAIFEARVRIWNGVSRKDRWAILGGQQVVPAKRQTPPFWVRNRAMNQLYLSSSHINQANASAFYHALEDYQPTHLITYSSSAAALARTFLDLNHHCSSLRVVLTNAEPLLPGQREAISQVLAKEVRETYGLCELVTGASECTARRLHLWPEVGLVEVLSQAADEPAPADKTGRLICTGLLNSDMPLIRYELGDRCTGVSWAHQCPCGRSLPVVSGIEGRNSDLLISKDGRHVFWINPVFYGLPIAEAQVIQEALDQVRVLLIPAPGFTDKTKSTIQARLSDRLGGLSVDIETVVSIPRGSNGKFRPVICKVQANGGPRLSSPEAIRNGAQGLSESTRGGGQEPTPRLPPSI